MEEIQRIFSPIREEGFEKRMSELRSFEQPLKIESAVDVLGIYRSRERTIYLHPNRIHSCAERLAAHCSAIRYEALYRVVMIHEEAHALHHLAADRKKGYRIWDEFDEVPSCLQEILAQRFAYEDCKQDSSLLLTFEALENTQPLAYKLWRLFKISLAGNSLLGHQRRDRKGRANSGTVQDQLS